MGGATGSADDFLEDYYDVIVLSTGLGSSILAAALAKAGKTVLHLDSHDHYGQDSASFSFTQLLDWAEETRTRSGGRLNQDHPNPNPNPSTNANPDTDPDLPGSTDAANKVETGGSPSFDGARAGTAIARALCRNQLEKERAAADKAAAAATKDDAEKAAAAEVEGSEVVSAQVEDAANVDDGAKVNQADASAGTAEEAVDKDTEKGEEGGEEEKEGAVGLEEREEGKVEAVRGAEAEAEEGAQQQQQQRPPQKNAAEFSGAGADPGSDADSGAAAAAAGTTPQAAAAAAAIERTPPTTTTTTTSSSSSSSTEKSGTDKNSDLEKREEDEERERAKREAAEEEERAIDAAATTRLLSLDLHLLPLAYHGCRARAGPPSDACVRERADVKAAEKAAATFGCFGRPLSPSHPAWSGRREPSKDYGRVCSAATAAAGGGDGDGGGGGRAAPFAAAATAAAAVGRGEGEGNGVEVGSEAGMGGGVGGDGGEGCWDESMQHPSFWGYRTERRPSAADLVRLSRSFNLDLTSQVLLATGPAVDTLVSSGVASYLEFKDMQGLYLGSDVAPAAGGGARGWGVRKTAAATGKGAAGEGGGGGGGGGGGVGGGAAANGRGKNSGGGGGGSGSGSSVPPTPGLALSRVPCSKADVFGTKLLTPLEKRRLMRFLLFASDWGLQRAGEDVLARNEAGLGRGRSLRRPQNREAASSDFDADTHSGKPFRVFLESCGLPERVRAMIIHALALLPGSGGVGGGVEAGGGELWGEEASTEEGLEAVCRHLSALGRFGETAFIAPLYGVGELSQSFCRMAAVHGAVYVLRRQLKGAVVDRVTKRCVGVIDESGRAFACGSVVVGGEYFDASPGIPLTATTPTTTTTATPEVTATANIPDIPRPAPSSAGREATAAGAGATVREGAAIAPGREPAAAAAAAGSENAIGSLSSSLSSPPPPPRKRLGKGQRRLLRRVVVASGPVAPEGAGRGLCVLPPRLRCVGNPAAVHAVSLDEGTAACPAGLDGACVLHLTTTSVGNSNASENTNANSNANSTSNNSNSEASTNSAPLVSSGGGLVNVGEARSERGGGGAGEGEAEGVRGGSEVPEGAVIDEDGSDGVLGRSARELLAAAGVHELWSVGFSWDVDEPPPPEDLPPNMVVCGRPTQELYLHDVVVKAESAFGRLCPGEPFWPPPSKTGPGHSGDDGDDQAEMLRAAASTVTDTVPSAVADTAAVAATAVSDAVTTAE